MNQNTLTFAEISFIIINVNKNNKRELVKLKIGGKKYEKDNNITGTYSDFRKWGL